ncbi:MAG: response regulator [Chloroflexi bacterium]|nr:response regulator [Chloroflexota bacterium]
MPETSLKKTILVVEDDKILGKFMVDLLEEELNAQVLLALNGRQALTVIETVKPDLFVLDYQLPDMNGLHLYDRLHALEELKDVPALVVSANAPIEEIRRRHLSFLPKPFDLDELILLIQQLLAKEKISC